MMSASVRPWDVDAFLAWERQQELRWEFDGVQPVAMTDALVGHARRVAALARALDRRVPSGCEVFTETLKVRTLADRIRYPDVLVTCGPLADDDDAVSPVLVFEVLSPSTEPTDRRVKVLEYQAVPSILAYVILDPERPVATLRRRADGWVPHGVEGRDAVLTVPGLETPLPLAEIYPAA